MTPERLETILQSLCTKRHIFARLNAPRTVQVKGQVYRLAETIADQLLALSIEIQDYDLPNLDNWTDLSNRMLAALDLGKDSIEVAGKSFTAQQLYETLGRLLRKTQQQHQQLWKEKELARKQRLDQTPPLSRGVPEFYRDPEFRKPTLDLKPPTTKTIASMPAQVKFRGSVYHLAAPALPPEYNIPVDASDLDPEVISWFHSSQGDPIYALGSRLQAYGDTLASEDELVALNRTLDKWLMEDHEDDRDFDRISELYHKVNEILTHQLRTSSAHPSEATQSSVPKNIKLKGAVYRLADPLPSIEPLPSFTDQVEKLLNQVAKLMPEVSWHRHDAPGLTRFVDIGTNRVWSSLETIEALVEQISFAFGYQLASPIPDFDKGMNWKLVPTRKQGMPEIEITKLNKLTVSVASV